jgi:hypothetical protein
MPASPDTRATPPRDCSRARRSDSRRTPISSPRSSRPLPLDRLARTMPPTDPCDVRRKACDRPLPQQPYTNQARPTSALPGTCRPHPNQDAYRTYRVYSTSSQVPGLCRGKSPSSKMGGAAAQHRQACPCLGLPAPFQEGRSRGVPVTGDAEGAPGTPGARRRPPPIQKCTSARSMTLLTVHIQLPG